MIRLRCDVAARFLLINIRLPVVVRVMRYPFGVFTLREVVGAIGDDATLMDCFWYVWEV